MYQFFVSIWNLEPLFALIGVWFMVLIGGVLIYISCIWIVEPLMIKFVDWIFKEKDE